ncbi:Phosphatidylinositol-glycan biosynthesis class F protein [Phytophthora citrophthora]|uniref:Phosphatidylinositol-glycan biosynthesis class F protein n=1 Tax=Phytophthora citrophthora TaxID=4793 RepID=A0AAD9GGS8_9STRA|nr:Phosphatidylinositol-glycan biosynthesis class F protein [Phytophthora citrophthora]
MEIITGVFSSIASGRNPGGYRFSFVNPIVWDVLQKKLRGCGTTFIILATATSSPRLVMTLLPKVLQLVLPGIVARYLPVLLFGQHLEEAVLHGLVPVVATISVLLLASNLLILRSTDQTLLKQIAKGCLGLVLGSVMFHVTVVLFGAPVVELWRQTLLLSLFLSSCVTVPLALHLGVSPREWLDLLLELRVSDPQKLYIVCSSIGAMVGAYVGALPIPLDWDRPWQQWPLTCVYGTLIGHAVGILTSIVLSVTLKSAKSTKKD